MPDKTQQPESSTETTLSQLQWLEGWLSFMSKPGPKANINGVLHEYPEASRLKVEKQLASVRQEIARVEYLNHKASEKGNN